ncbi:MAG: arabinogalactan endo-1,4-beta-galactosidase, partial [Fibrobacter sp.]|nr:arabinogalactan endo-1,4-beta-galactosidase [Fibrobacter sp.]
VQVGNEITNGMLRDLPTSSTNCWGDSVQLAPNSVNGVMDKQQNPNGIANTAKYLKKGSLAVKSFETSSHKIKTVFHIESPQNSSTVNWWMSSIIKTEKVAPDVMAFSAYSAYGHGTPDTWKKLISDLASSYPNLEFLIAEYNGGTGKNFYSFDGSRAKTHQIMEQVPRGLGAFFWEPASYGEWGSALLDWDGNTLKANPKAFDEYKVLFR